MSKPKNPDRDSIEKIILPEREININDIHYANLKAVIEAESGLDAVRKYIEGQNWDVLRSEEQEITEPDPVAGETCLIREMELEKGYGPMRTQIRLYKQAQMANFKISIVDRPDKLIWVYKMGNHWVICT
jgi:hypothetical protein